MPETTPTHPKKKAAGHFGRQKALMALGWWAVMRPTERSLWMAYQDHADADGVAYPGGETLAAMIGHADDGHIGRTRQSLVNRGLLEVIEKGGGRHKPWKVRLLIPNGPPPAEMRRAKRCQTGTVSEGEKGCQFGAETVPVSREKGASFAEKGCQFRGSLYKEEQTIEQSKEQITPRAAPRPADPKANEGIDRKPAKGTPKPGKFPEGVWERAVQGWETAWQHVHGSAYVFVRGQEGRDFKGLTAALTAVGGDLPKLAEIIRAYLREPDWGRTTGHPMHELGNAGTLNSILSKIAQGKVGQNGHATTRKPNSFIGTGRALPDVPEADRVA